jgi:protein required for attachment to host cells
MTILVMVADGAYAKLLTTRSQKGELQLWEEHSHPASRLKNLELTTDGPGTGRDSGGQGRHSMGHERETHLQEERKFADELAAKLQSAINEEVHKIYLISPPRFLGLLRAAISPEVKKRIVAEMAHDLTQHTARDIRAHLPEYL